MSKRSVATFLWALTTLCFYELAWSLTGIPRVLGPILATDPWKRAVIGGSETRSWSPPRTTIEPRTC